MKRPQQLTSAALEARLKSLCKRDDVLEALVIEHLAEFIGRELHREHSLRSVFDYCTTILGFSRDVAQKRIRAARAVLVRPDAIEFLRARQLTVSSLAAVAPVIEVADAFDYALGRSKRDVEKYVAILRATGRAPRGGENSRSEARKTVDLRLAPRAQSKLEKARQMLCALESVEAASSGETVVELALDALIETLATRAASSLEEEAAYRGKDRVAQERREDWRSQEVGATFAPAGVGPLIEDLGDSKAGSPSPSPPPLLSPDRAGRRRSSSGVEYKGRGEQGAASRFEASSRDRRGSLHGQRPAAPTAASHTDPSVPRLLSDVGAPRLGAFITLKRGQDTTIYSLALRRPFIRSDRRVGLGSSDRAAGEPEEAPSEPDCDAG